MIRGVLCQHDDDPKPWRNPSSEFPGDLTAEDFDRISQDGIQRELLDGKLFGMPPLDAKHMNAAKELENGLRLYLLPRRLGWVKGIGTGVLLKCNPDTVRTPHILYEVDPIVRTGSKWN